MINTSSGRPVILAALCICCAHTFIDGSAKAMGFASALAASLDAYIGSNTEVSVVAEIRKLTGSTWLPKPMWTERQKKEQEQALVDIITTHRLRLHEERKAQAAQIRMDRANLF
ncbi:hypothetical protein C8R45DRAFT_594261 [Mycena sanguinolenta]|nr:hypothetical protein C8R45DRAFT_594261 [Mycena sanguinolenta]